MSFFNTRMTTEIEADLKHAAKRLKTEMDNMVWGGGGRWILEGFVMRWLKSYAPLEDNK